MYCYVCYILMCWCLSPKIIR